MKEVIITILTIGIVYLLFIKDNTNARWNIEVLNKGNYTYKEIVNILGAPDSLDFVKGFILWIDSSNHKVLIAGLNNEDEKIDINNIIVDGFHIKNSLSNTNIKKYKPCFKKLANFKLKNKGIVGDCN